MSKFSVGDRVIAIEDSTVRKGRVTAIFDDLWTAVVAFEDGDVEKKHVDDIAILEEKSEAKVELSEITITPEEFRRISAKIIAEESKDYPLVALSFSSIMAKVHKALFIDEVDV